jgi:predicted anti-sigma-YlaC factor YlaD
MAELVTDYLERTLPLRLRLDANVHLLLCSACRHYFDQMRKTVGFLGRMPRSAPDRAVEEQLVRAATTRDEPSAPP